MRKQHEQPTHGQMAEFWKKVSLGSLTKKKLQEFLDSLNSRITLDEALAELELAMQANSPNNYSIDSYIKTWFKEDEVNQEPFLGISTSVHRFSTIISHRKIIAERKQAGDYLEVGLVEGITLVTELIRNNEVQKGRGIIIYLTNTRSGDQCRLYVSRDDDGKLLVSVDEVDLDRTCLDGSGVVRKAL